MTMNCISKVYLLTILILRPTSPGIAEGAAASREQVQTQVEQEYPNLFELYKHLHTHPELSFQEEKTSARVAQELRKSGYEVATGIGKHGVVAVLRNGA